MSIRYDEMTVRDYADVMALWQKSEGIGLSAADSLEAISAYLARNPGHSFVARDEDQIVGAVLCGHDGRRGYMHHLAVQSDHRRQGIGEALVEQCLARLKTAGIDKCHIFVYTNNQEGQNFWKKTGWAVRTNLALMSREF
ncbi:MAG: GNAT family N-acetyltransferase [Anaerolineaceae bacterium]|nr:GNAT family N-acetyltransferase [Anaerolineaceae bacterium]